MAGTLLLDLDDTLLANPMEQFLPGYFKGIGGTLQQFAPPEKVVKALLDGTQKMVENRQIDRTLLEVFYEYFYPALGAAPGSMRADIERFYAEDFPALRHTSRAKPEAIAFVQQAFAAGYTLAVATNPLFPATAIRQRLEWAGLSPDTLPFTVISSNEDFHFCKPNPAYYTEMLARLGWPEGPVVMLGDDLEMDIAPTRRLGLAAYWVPVDRNPMPPTPPIGELAPSASGNLEQAWEWLQSASATALTPEFTCQEMCANILRGSPAALQTMLAGCGAEEWRRRPVAGEWSLAEILCHLRDVEIEINLQRVDKILNETNPLLIGIDTDRWAEQRRYAEQDGLAALQAYLKARRELLQLLDGMEPESWNKPARHTIFGRTTLKEIIHITAGHERLHVRQIYKTLKVVS